MPDVYSVRRLQQKNEPQTQHSSKNKKQKRPSQSFKNSNGKQNGSN